MRENFGSELKKYRELRHLTQRQLLQPLWDSEKCDRVDEKGQFLHKYNEPDVSKWESNTTRPPADVVDMLEKQLITPEGLLLEAAGYIAEAKLKRLKNKIPESSLISEFIKTGGFGEPVKLAGESDNQAPHFAIVDHDPNSRTGTISKIDRDNNELEVPVILDPRGFWREANTQ